MKQQQSFLSLDIGASSGRGILGRFDGKALTVNELYRFDHYLCTLGNPVYWDVLELFRHMKNILRIGTAGEQRIDGIGIDTWGLDYGLLDSRGNLLGNVISYRNAKAETVEEAWKRIGNRELYSITGVGHMMINTVYQLYERRLRGDPLLDSAETLLMLPDLLAYFLCGERCAEYTSALTTMLVDIARRNWSDLILQKLDIPRRLFAPIQMPATLRGYVSRRIRDELQLPPIPLFSVASHDTASAIAAVPARDERFVYISSGTWSLIGTEIQAPILSEAAFQAGYSNEGSLQGAFRLNKNIVGLGLIQECKRIWQAEGRSLSWDDIVQEARNAEPFQAFLDPDAVEFFDLQHMNRKISAYCAARGKTIRSLGEIARCAYESLAMKYRLALSELENILGERFQVIHIVGGGCKNRLLNQFTANACNRPVYAGPAEGTSMANLLTQAMAKGEIHGISQLREVVRNSVRVEGFSHRTRRSGKNSIKISSRKPA